MKRASIKQVKVQLQSAIAKCCNDMDAFTGDKNPQVKDMLIATIARKEALEAVYSALNGNDDLLNIMAYNNY